MASTDHAVRRRLLRQDEFPAFIAASTKSYALGLSEQGGWDPEAALAQSVESHKSVLPAGLDTPGHAIFVLETGGERVGLLWVAERDVAGRHVLFIYDIEIDEAFRGRGYGRAAMLLAEKEARERGIGRVDLNVFGRNAVARNLYRSLGYVENSVQMSKDVDTR